MVVRNYSPPATFERISYKITLCNFKDEIVDFNFETKFVSQALVTFLEMFENNDVKSFQIKIDKNREEIAIDGKTIKGIHEVYETDNVSNALYAVMTAITVPEYNSMDIKFASKIK